MPVRGLPGRWILSVLALVLLTAVVAGLPAQTVPTTPAPTDPAPSTTPAAPATTTPATTPATTPPASSITATEETALNVNTTPRKAIVLSMKDAVKLTLENSMDIKVNRIPPQTAAAAIEKAESRFDWTFTGTWTGGRNQSPSLDPVTGHVTTSRTDTEDVKVGLKKEIITGGTIQPGVEWTRTSSSPPGLTNPSYNANAFVTITQPLMRNAGTDVNLAETRQARFSHEIAKYQFKDAVITTLTNMEGTYWDLVFAIEDLEVKKKSLRLTKDTLEQTRAQVEAGLLAPIEITRVRADVASKESDILDAQRTVQEKEDLLRQFINKKGSRLLDDIGVIPLERAAYQAVTLDLEREALFALAYRPDYNVDKFNIKNRDIDLVVAKNAKLPQVDLQLTLGANGIGASTDDAFSSLGRGDALDWQAQVNVAVPIGNRGARAGYLAARLAKVKALLDLKNLEDDIIVAVKQNVRLVDTNLKRISTTRLARELAEERLKAEEEKFNVGTALILDVLDAQTKLAQAESDEALSVVNYNKALISLEKTKGTLLERNGILLNTELGPPEPARQP